MATTPQRKVTAGKPRKHGNDMSCDPPFFGIPETLKSGGARYHDTRVMDSEAESVEGEAPVLNMERDFVAGNSGWPGDDEGD